RGRECGRRDRRPAGRRRCGRRARLRAGRRPRRLRSFRLGDAALGLGCQRTHLDRAHGGGGAARGPGDGLFQRRQLEVRHPGQLLLGVGIGAVLDVALATGDAHGGAGMRQLERIAAGMHTRRNHRLVENPPGSTVRFGIVVGARGERLRSLVNQHGEAHVPKHMTNGRIRFRHAWPAPNLHGCSARSAPILFIRRAVRRICLLGAERLQSLYSARSASTALTRAARAAGTAAAMAAAATMTAADATRLGAPGIVMGPIQAASARAPPRKTTNPATTPSAAITTPSRTTLARILRGSAPSAIRMPNSRVRPLTENPSTPATPITEISNATMAKPPKTRALILSGARISVRTSWSVAACSTGWSGEICWMVRTMVGTSGSGLPAVRTKRRPPQPS